MQVCPVLSRTNSISQAKGCLRQSRRSINHTGMCTAPFGKAAAPAAAHGVVLNLRGRARPRASLAAARCARCAVAAAKQVEGDGVVQDQRLQPLHLLAGGRAHEHALAAARNLRKLPKQLRVSCAHSACSVMYVSYSDSHNPCLKHLLPWLPSAQIDARALCGLHKVHTRWGAHSAIYLGPKPRVLRTQGLAECKGAGCAPGAQWRADPPRSRAWTA